MIQDIAPHVFHNEYTPRPITELDAVVCFDGSQILMDIGSGENHAVFPQLNDFTPEDQKRIKEYDRLQYLFSIDEMGFFLVSRDCISTPGETLQFLHIQKVRQQTVVQLRCENLQERHCSEFLAHREIPPVFEFKRGRCDKILDGQSARHKPVP